jgi:hypothetical protein
MKLNCRSTPAGFQKSAWACDLRRSAYHAAGMITDLSLRLIYLIVDRFLSWLVIFPLRTSPAGGSDAAPVLGGLINVSERAA